MDTKMKKRELQELRKRIMKRWLVSRIYREPEPWPILDGADHAKAFACFPETVFLIAVMASREGALEGRFPVFLILDPFVISELALSTCSSISAWNNHRFHGRCKAWNGTFHLPETRLSTRS